MYLKLAWRNIWRNKRRTQIMVASICFALIYSTFTQSNKYGLYENMTRASVKLYTGYLQAQMEGFWEERSINSVFLIEDSLIQALENTAYIDKVVPRIESFALASSGDRTRGAMVMGIDPVLEQELTGLAGRLVDGAYLEHDDRAILVGEGMASYFKHSVGDTLILVGQGLYGTNAVDQFIIKGIVKYPVPDMNNHAVILPFEACSYLYDTYGQATNYCFLVNPDKVKEAGMDARSLIDLPGVIVMDWEEMLPSLVQSIAWDQFMIRFIFIILYAIIGFGIFSTFYMMINERQYEFGVIIASGMKRTRLQAVAVLEVILLSIIGIGAGLIVSGTLLTYLYLNPIQATGSTRVAFEDMGLEPVILFSLDSSIFLTQSIAVMAITLIVGLYAPYKIGKMDVVTSIRQ